MAKNIHVTPRPEGKWQIKTENSKRAYAITSTQREAINKARPLSKANGVELFIHGRDGRIRERDTHGHDPCPPKG